MLVNPGGLIAPEDVVGRDELIARIWRRLERQSVVLTAPRRTGKTCILNRMRAEVAPGFVVLTEQPDVEGLHSPLEFVERVYRDAERLLPTHHRRSGFRRAFEALAGFELGGLVKFSQSLAPNWKRLLEALLAALDTVPGERLVFLWDEMPVFVNNVKRRTGEDDAAGILDALRAVRQKHPRIRMVFTGSIGFHSVIDALARAGINSPLLNDMYVQEVPPLLPDDGAVLAARLLESEGVWTTDRASVARAVASAAGDSPFYIHHLVDALTERAGPHDEANVSAVVTQRLHADGDPWLMKHYYTRTEHYPHDRRPIALAILDVLASTGPLRFDALLRRLHARHPTDDAEPVREMIMLLKQDFYITQSEAGTLEFRSALLREWWKHTRT